jgi:hypothetical protein
VIDYAIRTRLLAVSAVADLIGGTTTPRIYPIHLPQDPKFPAITYQIISGQPEYDLEGARGLADTRIQIDCWARAKEQTDGYDSARDLAEAVRGALSGYSGTVGSDVIQECFLAGRRTSYEADAEIYRESLDFAIGYTET